MKHTVSYVCVCAGARTYVCVYMYICIYTCVRACVPLIRNPMVTPKEIYFPISLQYYITVAPIEKWLQQCDGTLQVVGSNPGYSCISGMFH